MEHYNSKRFSILTIAQHSIVNSSNWARFDVNIFIRKTLTVCLSVNRFVNKVFSVISIKILCIGENIFFQFTQK